MEDMKKYAAGEWLIEKMMEGTYFAGTGTKQELIELEKNLRHLLQLKMYPYLYIENYLMQQGYSQKDIRRIFYEITGVKATDFLAEDAMVKDVPDEIPSINLGWGESKSKKYDYLFIMPWLYGFSIFGQKGDLEREIIKSFDILEDAREELKKMVKEYRQFNRVPELKPHKVTEDWASSFSEPKYSSLSEAGKSIADFIKLAKGSLGTEESIKYIKSAYYDRTITKDDLAILLKIAENEKEEETSVDIEDVNMQQELKENTPNSFYEHQIEKKQNVSHYIEQIENYLDEKNKEISPTYKLYLKSFKYIETNPVYSDPPNVEGPSKTYEPLKSEGSIAVVLDVKNTNLPEGNNIKPVLIVFSIVDGKLETSGIIKDINENKNSLTREGLDNLFSKENTEFSHQALF